MLHLKKKMADNEMSNAHNITHVSNTEDCDLNNSTPKVAPPSPVSASGSSGNTFKDIIATRDSQLDFKPCQKRKFDEEKEEK